MIKMAEQKDEEKKEEKKEEGKKEEGKEAKNETKSGNATGNATKGGKKNETAAIANVFNWWDVYDQRKKVELKDDTPFEVKSHPDYKKMVGRYLSGHFQDDALETMKKRNAKATINHDEIGEEKEREGMYPNDLDQEMQGYTWGERLTPAWRPYVAAYGYYDYWNSQGTLAPPFDPAGHFESPYYDYGNNTFTAKGPGYWGVRGFDPWSAPWALLTEKP